MSSGWAPNTNTLIVVQYPIYPTDRGEIVRHHQDSVPVRRSHPLFLEKNAGPTTRDQDPRKCVRHHSPGANLETPF